ncbi:T9SS type A sorting domain-containing protein [Flavobacterium sp. HJJ]|uniref:T9SS type A sorting domain-containing protein n=1 Tax=Flavobacterium sp. HJJ TaxID=2783792 RepID=UPI00188AFB8F|nr:T9SS type A sorting domain-containing protein [Flavobacterium sp. HJJ]MBF4473286.1 T9SS type A sorting domain-containing protein [Flavobacterium sp. HJJ]
MKKKLLILIVFISLNLYPKDNSSVSTPLSSVCAITNSYCYGSNSGSLHIVAIGGQSPYTYSINNGSFQSIIFDTFNLSPGTYNIITKDALGATVFNSVVVTEPAILNAAVTVSGQNITVNATGGTAPYAYWLTINGSLAANAQTSDTFSNLAPGTYTVSVKDSNGCLVIIEDAIIKPPLNATITITKQIDCNSNASLMAAAAGGQGPYAYSINDGAKYQAANIFDNLSPGTYTITVKDSQNTITNTKPITITPLVPVSGVALITNPVDCSTNSSITVVATAGQAPYNYSFDGGATYTTSDTFYNVPAGDYVCFVRDQNNCVSPAMLITVENYPTLKATVSSGTLLCAKDKTSLTVTAAGGKSPYQYSLNDNPYSSNNTYTNVGFGNYGLTIKDANDCLIKVSHTVIEPEPILADFIINEQTLTINGKGGIAPYQFSVDSTAYQSDNVFNNLSVGNHKILIKDSKGCESNTFSASIKASPLTNLITLTKKLDCNSNAEITITTSGGIAPYTYSLNGNPYQSSNIFSNLSAGIYYVIVKDATNTISTTNTITVVPPIPITANATITKPIDCVSNASIKIDVSGGNGSYLYSMNGGSYGVSNLFTNLTSGTYRFTVKDSSNCTVLTNDIILIQPTLLTATATKTNITCSGSSDGMIYINTTGGQAPYEYSIGNGNVFQKSNIFNGLSAGSYNVTIRDSLGCLAMIFVDIIQPTLLNATTMITKPIDCLSNASLNVTATGGVAPYKYSIDGGIIFASTSDFSNLTAGTYSVYVKDSNGCIANNSVSIKSQSPLLVNTTKTDISCKGANTGSVTVIATGGQSPYTYSIGNTYQTSNVFNGLSAGLQNIVIKDALGCLVSTNIIIAEPATPLTATVETKDQTITINGTGGTGIINYAISPNLGVFTTNNTFTSLAPGIYTTITQDQNGCYLSFSNTINPPAPLVDSKKAININFTKGQTLADIKIDIPNIKWYLKESSTTSKTSKTAETELPLTTVIVEGTTYYASQTINGIESKERLAVTTKLSTLGTNDFDITNFAYYPNPVKNILTFSNTSTIDEVSLISIKGETILIKKIKASHSEIDLSNISSGVYFLKIQSENKQKTMKIIKE